MNGLDVCMCYLEQKKRRGRIMDRGDILDEKYVIFLPVRGDFDNLCF